MIKLPNVIIKEIVRVVPFTYDVSNDEYKESSNMESEFQGMIVKDINDVEQIMLFPTRGESKTKNLDLVYDLSVT